MRLGQLERTRCFAASNSSSLSTPRKCTTRIAPTPHQYEAVRANPTHFIVAPSREHLVPDAERVIDPRERYWIVEKLGGAAAVAEQPGSTRAYG